MSLLRWSLGCVAAADDGDNLTSLFTTAQQYGKIHDPWQAVQSWVVLTFAIQNQPTTKLERVRIASWGIGSIEYLIELKPVRGENKNKTELNT